MANDALFEKCFNHLIAHQYAEAYYQFSDSYYKNPQSRALFYGLVIAYLLQGKIAECLNFLEKEATVSPLAGIIASLRRFLEGNRVLRDQDGVSLLYNIGLFLKKSGQPADARIFFRTCQIIDPSHAKSLAALAESEIREGNIEKGVRMFARAASSSNK